jgi:hypothetical protein
MRTISSLLSVLVLSLTVFAGDFAPVDGRHYGMTTSGIFFVSAEMVNAAEGSSPKLRAPSTGWEDKDMKLSGSYYIYDSGRKMSTAMAVSWCVNIGGNRFLPHALESCEDPGKFVLVDSDIMDNGIGGYNFRTKPIN